MDDGSQESEIMLAKQHHEMLLKKKKADKKKKDDAAFNKWTLQVTLDSIVLSSDFGSIASIDSKPVDAWNMKYLRALCSKFKISGYKNARRDQMVHLLCERKKNEVVERNHYGIAAAGVGGFADDIDDESQKDAGRLIDRNCQEEAEYDNMGEDDAKMPAVSSPVTRSTARAAAALAAANKTHVKRPGKNLMATMESSAAKRPKVSKGTVPSAVTLDGTYYRAINVWFDERNRVDIVNMGSSPSIRELDARKKFRNKSTYDKLLHAFLDNSTENIAVSYIGFNNEYLNDCGITDQYASEFDILTSEDLCKVLDYVVYWYNVAYRNNQTSGNHADFHQFVGTRPYVYYYHLWLVEIPHLSFLAVPQLSGDVFRLSMAKARQDDDDANSASFSNGSISSNDEVFTIVSPPPLRPGSTQRKHSTPCSNPASTSTGRTSTPTTGRDNIKMHLLQSHLQSLEKFQTEAAQQRKNKDERDQRLALTVELKAVEDLLVMKKSELKAFDSDVDSESEKEFVCQQIKKLRKKQRSLTVLVYGSDNDESL